MNEIDYRPPSAPRTPDHMTDCEVRKNVNTIFYAIRLQWRHIEYPQRPALAWSDESLRCLAHSDITSQEPIFLDVDFSTIDAGTWQLDDWTDYWRAVIDKVQSLLKPFIEAVSARFPKPTPQPAPSPPSAP